MNFNIRDIKTYKRFTLTGLLILISLVVYSCNPLDDGSTANTGFIPFPPSSSLGLQLTSISPTSGAAAGGTSITITGVNFSVSGTTTVEIGGVPATSVVVASTTSITAVTGGHVAGAADVVVVGPNGSSNLTNGFTFVGPPLPALVSVSPVSGTTLGGATVTLTGSNLTGTTDVTFDSVSATNITVVNSTTVTADTPAHVAGAVDVAVTTSFGTANLTNAYTYVLLPAISSVSPTTSTVTGGTGFVLTGVSLSGTTEVTFGGVSATNVVVVNSTTVTGVTPAHAAGAVNVVAVGPHNPTLSNGYTYAATTVGQPTVGGLIGCLGGGLQNLIVAATNSSMSISWGSFITTGAYDSSDGQANTTQIVAVLGANGGTPYAAQLCDDLEIDSQGNTPCQAGNACYNDWFLPTTDQYSCIFTNQVSIGLLTGGIFWTSRDGNSSLASAINMGNGSVSTYNKSNGANVRCARAFVP